MSLLLLLSCLILPVLAGAADAQALVYDLSVGDRVVGRRDVTIHHIEVDGARLRMIESTTTVEVDVAGATWAYADRGSARVDARGAAFTAAVSENGVLREVQARSRRDGSWIVTVIEDGHRAVARLTPGEVDLSSMELFDPVRHDELTARPRAEVLMAETGTVLAGPVEDLGEATIDLGGTPVAVHRWAWTPPSGRVEFAWSLDGLLVSYQTVVLGRRLSARLRALPPPPGFGEIAPVGDVVEDVAEEEL